MWILVSPKTHTLVNARGVRKDTSEAIETGTVASINHSSEDTRGTCVKK